MTNIVQEIRDNNLVSAKKSIEASLKTIVESRKVELVKKISAEIYTEHCDFSNEEVEILSEARFKIVRARIRGGKIQRRKKVSNVKGFTFRGGKLTRMTPTERRNRRLGQRRGKIKRRAKLSRTLMKRKRSIRKRKAMGLGE